jgi:YVTN family beta-propeller protein
LLIFYARVKVGREDIVVGHAKFVGRVGALAVALGVGVALANSSAIASADDSSSAASSDAGAGKPVSASSKPVKTGPKARPTAKTEKANKADKADKADKAVTRADSTKKADRSAQVAAVSEPEAEAAPARTALRTKAAAPTLDVAAAAPVPAATASAPAATPNVPGVPDVAGNLLGFLSEVRRQLAGAIYNQAPTATALQIGENAQGQVIGAVRAVDPDGDPVKFAVIEAPKYGTLSVDDTGVYTYTPGLVLAEKGGVDSFVVQVSDVGTRLFSQPGVTTVPVTVTVGAGSALGIGGAPYGVAVRPDGTKVYVTDIDNNRVSVIDVATNAVVGSIAVGKSPWGIAVGADGRAYVANSSDGTVSVIDTFTDTVLGDVAVGNSPTSVAVDGHRVYVTNTNDDTVSVINTDTYATSLVAVGDSPFGVAVSGGKVFVTNDEDDTVTVFDAATNTVVGTIAVGDHPTGIAAGGGRVVVTNSGSSAIDGDGTVTLIDAATLQVVGDPLKVGDFPTNVVVNADGTRAYVTDFGYGTVSTIDLQTGTVLGTPVSVGAAVDGVAGVAIGPDGKLYVAGAVDGAVDAITLDTPAEADFAPMLATAFSSVAAQTAAATGQTSAAPSANLPAGSKTFKIYNLTSSTVTVLRYEGSDRPLNGYPPAGTTIAPGGSVDVVVTDPGWFSRTNIGIVLSDKKAKDATTWTAWMRYDRTLTTDYLVGAETSGPGDVTPRFREIWFVKAYRLGDEITLLEKPNTTIDVFPSNKDQTAVMNSLCTSGRVTCQFTAKGEAVQTWTEYRPPTTAPGVSSVINNGTSVTQKRTITYTVNESTKTNTEFNSKLNITFAKDLLGLELSAKYGSEVSNSKTWSDTYELQAPPYKQVSLLVTAPVWQVTGDLVISYGNSTITMKDVTLTNPDPTRSPITDIRETDCTNCTPPKPPTPAPATALTAPDVVPPAVRAELLA